MPEELKLHLGCGKKHMPGYIHIDKNSFPHIDYIHDVGSLPMFFDSSVDLIYASHVIEYFDRDEVVSVLSEWKRVLKPKGVIRLAVPDFEALVEVYKEYGLSAVLGPLYGKWKVDRYYIFHKTVYDFNSLSELLVSVGFSNPRKWDWRKVFVKELKYYDDYSKAYVPHMDINGRLISLNVEANK